MLCNNHLLFNKISSSYRYKETVSFLNGWLAPLFQSAMVAAKKYETLLHLHLVTWLWHIKIFASWRSCYWGITIFWCTSKCQFPFTMSLCQNQISQLQLHLAWCTTSNAAVYLTIALSEITIWVLLAPMKPISAIFETSFNIRFFVFVIFPWPFLL